MLAVTFVGIQALTCDSWESGGLSHDNLGTILRALFAKNPLEKDNQLPEDQKTCWSLEQADKGQRIQEQKLSKKATTLKTLCAMFLREELSAI